jgi:signal transduction histidine kinase
MNSFSEQVARRLRESKVELSKQWLEQLAEIVPTGDSLPTERLLDRLPTLLEEIAGCISSPSDPAGEVSSKVLEEAAELGRLRHRQKASVRQILREFDLLARILEEFAVGEQQLANATPAGAAVEVVCRIDRAMRVLTQATVDTFISEYAATIDRQRQHLEDFNRMLSHELRGPMNTLRIVAALLAERDPVSADERKTLIDLIQGSVERSCALLQDLEALAGFRGHDDSPAGREVALDGALRAVADRLAGLAAANDVEIVVDDAAPSVTVDIRTLELALTNLIGNAIKYCDRGKDRRWVRVTASIGDDSQLRLAISDNGTGIAREDLPKVFERFFRGKRTRAIEGTGLGLAIVREAVQSLGGSVDVTSEIGEGTRFTIALPLTG